MMSTNQEKEHDGFTGYTGLLYRRKKRVPRRGKPYLFHPGQAKEYD
jgi:hypothetical protein